MDEEEGTREIENTLSTTNNDENKTEEDNNNINNESEVVVVNESKPSVEVELENFNNVSVEPAEKSSDIVKRQPENREESDDTLIDHPDKVDTTDNVIVNFDTLVEKTLSRVDNLSTSNNNINDEIMRVPRTKKNSKEKSSKGRDRKSVAPVRKAKKSAVKRKVAEKNKPARIKRSLRRRYSRRRRTYVPSYNEDDLMEKHIKECMLKFYLES